MKFVILLTIVYGIALAVSVRQDDEALQEFIYGNHKFSADVYKVIVKNENGNFLFSPLSVEVILALANEGARGDTSKELVNGLSLPDSNNKIRSAIKSVLTSLKRCNKVKLLSANMILLTKEITVENRFMFKATTIYNSGVGRVNFAKNVKVAAATNEWVENHTNNKIKNLIGPQDLDANTQMVLINALYFSGEWATHFHFSLRTHFFTTSVNFVDVEVMQITEYFKYYEDVNMNAKFLEIPYKGKAVSMVIILPNDIEGLTRLERNMDMLLAPKPYTKIAVNVTIPKFTTETKIQFTPILQNLGIKKLFGDADLTRLSSNYKGLYVQQVAQKAFINVTETGTEAAAATQVLVVGRSEVDYGNILRVFLADHPFLYLIKLNEIVLFLGRYNGPTNN